MYNVHGIEDPKRRKKGEKLRSKQVHINCKSFYIKKIHVSRHLTLFTYVSYIGDSITPLKEYEKIQVGKGWVESKNVGV